MSESRKGISSPMKGREVSDETKQKMSESRKGKKQSPEHARKRAESRIRNKQLKMRKINDTGGEDISN